MSPMTNDPESARMGRPGLERRPLKVIGIGAGASGLLLAYKIQRNFEDIDLTIYEKNDGVAGTWFENRYPGCACDNYSHCYTYSFEPKTDWTETYATSSEIKGYFEDFYRKYDLDRYIRLSSQVCRCEWDEKSAKWHVNVLDTATKIMIHDQADIVVNATGVLNSWKLPDVPGLDNFKGEIVHSANWDASLDLTNKIVGLVGNGSSAIQILPAVLPAVKRVVNFIRTPAWITTPFGNSQPRKFAASEIQRFNDSPADHLALRKEVEATNNGFFKMFLQGSREQAHAKRFFRQQMSEVLNDSELSASLIPDWSLGCRRLTPGVGYLKAISDPKVTVVREALAACTATTAVSMSGKSFDIDVLICASGFNTSFRPKYPVLGREGKDLRDLWADQPKGYMGIAVPEFPNYFTFLGPNCPIGNGPVLSAIEAQSDYICKFLKRIQTEEIRAVVPSMKAADEFMEYKQKYFPITVWNEDCNSWYKIPGSKRIAALWVGSTVHYLRAVEEPRYEDWEFTYKYKNRWAYLGNGLGPDDVDERADLAWYIRDHDDSPILGTKRIYSENAVRGQSVIGVSDDGGQQLTSVESKL